jgi:hypothetical protein
MMMMCQISEGFGFFPCGPTWFVCVFRVFFNTECFISLFFSFSFFFLGRRGEIPIGILRSIVKCEMGTKKILIFLIFIYFGKP